MEEAQQVERAIADQSSELAQQVSDLSARHALLVSEVAALEAALAAKRREEAAAAAALIDAEGRIKKIHAKFEKQTARIATKREAVSLEDAECSGEARAIAKAKEDAAAAKARDHLVEVALARQKFLAERELSVTSMLTKALEDQAKRRASLATAFSKASLHKQQLEADIDSAQQGCRVISSRKVSLEAAAANSRERIAALDAKLPALNEEKKLAVGERKFKEAGRLTEEIKKCTTDREAAEKELSGTLVDVDSCEVEMTKAEEALGKAKEALNVASVGADIARAGDIKEILISLRAVISKVDRFRLLPRSKSPSWSHPEVTSIGLEGPDENGLSTSQYAAIEMLGCERDIYTEELQTLANSYPKGIISIDLPAHVEEEMPHEEPHSEVEPEIDSTEHAITHSHVAPASVSPVKPASFLETLQHQEPARTASPEKSFLPIPSAMEPVLDVVPEESAASIEPVQLSEAPPSMFSFLAVAPGAGLVEPSPVIETSPEVAAPVALPDPAVTRHNELVRIGQEVAALSATIRSAEGTIEASVAKEDFDAADAAQAEIDRCIGEREHLFKQAADFGVYDEEELAQWASQSLMEQPSGSGFSFLGVL
jgi:hypothetical protein